MATATSIRDRISTPLYTVSDAARFAHTPRQTLKNWAEGYDVNGRWYPPLLILPEEQPFDQTALSFENLIEAALVAHWRRRGVPLQRIRRAHFLALEELGDHPFARYREIFISGSDLFVRADQATEDEGGRTFTVLTKGGQRALAPVVQEYLEFIDWQTGEGYAFQYRPPEGKNVVRLNPTIEFGLPNVRRIRTEVLLQRFLADESVDEIAADFALHEDEVEQALRYEWALPRAA